MNVRYAVWNLVMELVAGKAHQTLKSAVQQAESSTLRLTAAEADLLVVVAFAGVKIVANLAASLVSLHRQENRTERRALERLLTQLHAGLSDGTMSPSLQLTAGNVRPPDEREGRRRLHVCLTLWHAERSPAEPLVAGTAGVLAPVVYEVDYEVPSPVL